jgi:ferrochelatase
MKKAVILFNLGGPDSLGSVKPFLFNLFNDKYIINLPHPFRYLLAKYIAFKRTPFAQEIYKHLGNKSPIVEETEKQSAALKEVLGKDYEVFIAMRYWHPFIEEILPQINSGEFDEAILLPLYPQFSTTTSLSSINSCIDKISIPKKIICCYYNNPLFIEASVDLVKKHYEKANKLAKPILLFSAHSLPVSIIKKGDPYEFQMQESAKNIVEGLNIQDLEWEVCYQSKVGKQKWLEPNTEEVIKKYSDRPIVLLPIAFVSEHSETLVELDIEYGKLAKHFFRVPTVSTHPKFIQCLAELCLENFQPKACPQYCKKCIQIKI